jgi:hypothetical protein
MDPILYWNDVALEANRIDFTIGSTSADPTKRGKAEQGGPTLSSRALGIVHLAMYDAYAGIARKPTLPLYLPGLPAPPAGASINAAVAAAAHATLSRLFPSQKAFFDLRHAQAGLSGPGLADGHAHGLLVAQRILADRQGDPGAEDDGYAASAAHGAHRPDPDHPEQGYRAPFYGAKSCGFAISKRWVLDKPPQPGSSAYQKALEEVRGLGIAAELMGTVPAGYKKRNVDQTLIGIFWGYDGASGLGTPPRLYNQIVRKVAEQRNTGATATDKNARLFALVNVAMADAGILAWDQKYFHDLWRPVLGVREHDPSMGPTGTGSHNIDNDCDTGWLPLGAPNTNKTGSKNFTPPFPAYPSGHATFGAAALHMTRLFYGDTGADSDDLFDGLTFVSDEFNGINRDNQGAVRPRHVRRFPKGLAQMIEENGRSRVYLGVHWVFDAFAVKANGKPDFSKNVGGVPLGIKIAQDIYDTKMTKSPVMPRP